jgi:hypothetical protein
MVFRPGKEVFARSKAGLVRPVWAGFARKEILDWWLFKGSLLLDIPAQRFAERSDMTGRLIWGNVPDSSVIRGLLDLGSSHPVLRIITRSSNDWELTTFQHPRMPVLEPPLYGPVSEMETSAYGDPQGSFF